MADDKVVDQVDQGISRLESEAYDPELKKTPEVLVDWTPEEERKLVRKIDWRTIPYLSFVFGLSLLDRTNVSVAYIAGMSEDLDLAVGSRYSIALLLFFVPYMMCEIPSNMIIRRIGARWWLTALILCWGVCILAMGFVKHWVPLVILRILLGAFEAGLFPGALYILSAWYRTYESGQKVSIFYMASLVTTGFNGIFAYALSRISVGNGMFSSGWRWIFIVEGAVTIAAGVAGPFLLAEFPEKSTWLTERERHIVIRRVANDNAGRDYEHLNWKNQLKLLKDWKIAVYCLQYYVVASSIYSLGYFLPLILRESLGFSYTKAQLLFSPPYMFCIIMSILSGWVSDRLRIRWIFLVVQAAIGIAGLFIILFVHAPYVRHFGVFLGVWGIQANVPVTPAYNANNAADPAKKGIISAAMITAGGLYHLKALGAAGYYFSNPELRPEVALRLFNTWLGDPCRAVLAKGIVEEIESRNLVQQAAEIGTYIREKLAGLAATKPKDFGNVRGSGTIIAWDLESAEARNNIIAALRRRGVIVGSSGDRSIRLRPMLIFEKKHADVLVNALKEVTGA